jgi:hypothetical protein
MLTGAPAGHCRADLADQFFCYAFLAKADGLQKMLAGHAVGCVPCLAKFPERDDALNANDGFRVLAALPK